MEQLHQHIEDYLNDRLSDTDKADFEANLATDSVFREEVVKIQLLRQIAKRNATRAKIQEIQAQKMVEWNQVDEQNNETEVQTEDSNEEQEVALKPKFKVWRNLGSFAAAASIAVVCFLNFTDFTLPNQSTLAERGAEAEVDSIQQLNFENYVAAQKALKLGDNTTAIEYFEKVIAGEDLRPYYKDASKWFIAVANVEKNPEKAEELMQDILSKEDFKYEVKAIDKARMWTKIQVNKIKNKFK